jgi:hypothetical protein
VLCSRKARRIGGVAGVRRSGHQRLDRPDAVEVMRAGVVEADVVPAEGVVADDGLPGGSRAEVHAALDAVVRLCAAWAAQVRAMGGEGNHGLAV